MKKVQSFNFKADTKIQSKTKLTKPRKITQNCKNCDIKTITNLYENKKNSYLIPNKPSNFFTKKHVSITKMKNNRNNPKKNITSQYSSNKLIRNLKQITTNIYNYNFIGSVNEKIFNSLIYSSQNKNSLNNNVNNNFLNKSNNFKIKNIKKQKINTDSSRNITEKTHKIKRFLVDSKNNNKNSDYDYYTYLSIYNNDENLNKKNTSKNINDNSYDLYGNKLVKKNLMNGLSPIQNKHNKNSINIKYKQINKIYKTNYFSCNNLVNNSLRSTYTDTRNLSPHHQFAYSYYKIKNMNTFTYLKSSENHSCNNIKINKIKQKIKNHRLNNHTYKVISHSNKNIIDTTPCCTKSINMKSALNTNKKTKTKINQNKFPKELQQKIINSKKGLKNLYYDNSSTIIKKNIYNKKKIVPVSKTNEGNVISKITAPKNNQPEIDNISMQSMNDTNILELAKYIMKNNKEEIIDKNLVENLLFNKKRKGN